MGRTKKNTKKRAKQTENTRAGPEVKILNPETDLELDPDNPRFPPSDTIRTQSELLHILISQFKVDELAKAIVEAGYIDHDPIVGYATNSKVVIREGNRRLAAAQLLLNPRLAPTDKGKEQFQSLSEKLDPRHLQKIKSLKVLVYRDKNDPELEAYIGFRHINGTLKWPAPEKARFVVDLVKRHGWSYSKVAAKIGSYPKHVERHFIASRLIDQAVNHGVDGSKNITIGTLLRALQAKGIPTFLGVGFPGDPKLSDIPVPEERIDCLRDFVKWAFGTAKEAPILEDSRQLTQLAKILSSPEALRYLRRSRRPSFERAWIKSGGRLETTLEILQDASDRLEEAISIAADYRNDGDIADAVARCAELTGRLVRDFPEARKSYTSALSPLAQGEDND